MPQFRRAFGSEDRFAAYLGGLMPSPFPGMDPYLEGSLWTSVHNQLAVEISRTLTPRLVPKYAAFTERRFVMVSPEVEEGVTVTTTSIRPDAGVTLIRPEDPRGSMATALAAPLELTTVFPEPVPQITIEIRDTENQQLVAAIELLSPWNKQGDGRAEYLAKRQRLLLSSAHLMEIDLLRYGNRVPMREPLPLVPYFVFLSRARRRPRTQVWPIRLDERLPVVPLPLLPGDPDVPLDLQEAFNNFYDSFGYQFVVDYSKPPRPALTPQEAEWAAEVLRRRSDVSGTSDAI